MGYLLAENFKVIGQQEKVRPTWIISILASIFLLAGVILLPDDMDEFYNLFPLLNIGIAYLIYSTLQSEKVTKHIDAGGLIHNGGRVCGICIISFLISMGTFIVIYYIYEILSII